jgi:hypothetical protein
VAPRVPASAPGRLFVQWAGPHQMVGLRHAGRKPAERRNFRRETPEDRHYLRESHPCWRVTCHWGLCEWGRGPELPRAVGRC